RKVLRVVLASRGGKATLLSDDLSFLRVSSKDFGEPPPGLTRIALPRTGSTRSARFRRDVASMLVSLHVAPSRPARARAADPEVEREAARLESGARARPCHACSERAKHERWEDRASKRAQQMAR